MNVEPKVLIPEGCAALRCERISASVALTALDSAGSSWNDARATTSRGPRFELR